MHVKWDTMDKIAHKLWILERKISKGGARTSANVCIVIKENKSDHQHYLWATLWSQVCGWLPTHFPFYDFSLLKSYLPLLNAALWLTCWFQFVWFWLCKMELLISIALLLESEEGSVRKQEEASSSCNLKAQVDAKTSEIDTWWMSCLPLNRAS